MPARFRIIELGTLSNDAPSKILANVIKDYDNATLCKLPKLKAMTDVITRKRTKDSGFARAIYKDIPKILQNTLTNKRLLLYDSGVQQEERLLIFASDSSLESLKKCKT